MGNKIGSNWQVFEITPEGKREWMAESGNVCIADAAYQEALKQRDGREIIFVHGALILRREIARKPKE